MATNSNFYPNAKRPTSLEDGLNFQDFVADKLLRLLGIKINYYVTPHEQYEIGESVQGYEVKLDELCTGTGRLSIEIAEKSRATNNSWVASGIYRKDNTIFYVQGNYIKFYVFIKSRLIELHPIYAHTEMEKLGTVKTFYLPLQVAEREALYIFNEINPWNLIDRAS